ncbi:MAG: TonB-dependent receptor [Pseudomonadota bacterium]
MRKTRYLASTVLGSIAVLGAGALVPAAACAQDVPDQAEAAAEPAQDTTPAIVVTGSRIRRTTYTTPAPIDVITRDDTVLSGARSTAEVLQGSTVTSGTAQINNTFLGFVSEGGPAANTVGLRGLGSQRTLVLLNNRRLSPAGVGPQLVSADLNVLPSAILQRVEILREGASSIYGSDAIAGVVNIITDKRFNGITMDAFTSQPIEHGGGGRTYRLSAIAGKTFDRGHLTGSVEYRETTALKVGDREDFSCPTDLIYDPVSGQQIGQRTPDRAALRCFPFANGAVGTAQAYMFGLSFTTGAANRYAYVNGNPNSLINVNQTDLRPLASSRELENDVYSPVKTITGYLDGAWETGVGDIELYGEALFTRRISQQEGSGQISIDPNLIGFEVYGGTYAGQPLEDFGYPVSPFFPNALASPANGGNNIARVFIVPPILTSKQEVNYFRGNGGLRGSLGGGLHFDANLMYSRTAGTYSVQNIDTRRFRASLQPVLAPANTPDQYVTVAGPGSAGAGGRYTCASNVVGGAYIAGGNCVAADLFNPAALSGNLPPALFNYLYSDNVGNTTFDQLTAEVAIDGKLFELPGGPVGFAVGALYRHDRIADVPSEAAQTGNLYNFSSSGITQGTDKVWEAYGEVTIPLLKETPFFQDLTLSGSARYTHYDSYGSDTTYHGGVTWSPVKFLRFRGNYGTSFRAPNLYEQFVADQSGFAPAGSDPCDQFAAKFAPSSQRYINCLADLTSAIGAARAINYLATGGPEVFTRGGSGILDAEHSTSWGLGAIFEPRFAKLSIAVDYFNVTVNGEVSLLGTTILDRCYDATNFGAGNPYCALIQPRETVQGTLTSFLNPYLNIASQKVSGIDVSLRYGLDVGPGNLLLNARATRVIHQIYQPFAEEQPFDFNGTLGNQGFPGGPKWTGDADLRYRWDGLTIRYGVRFVGPMTSNPDDYPAPVVAINGAICPGGGANCVIADSDLHTGAYFEQSLSFQVQWKDVGQFTLGATNLFDRKPAQISSTGAFPRIGNYFNYSGYDFIGRSIFLNVTRSF